MSVRSLLLAPAIAVLLSAPSLAADMAVDNGPAFACAPPQEFVAADALHADFKTWNRRGDRPRMVYVEPFDPLSPPARPTPTYVVPQYAYLASSLCDFAYGQPQRSWYDGKLFYRPGGIRSAPDSFMIIERD